MSEEEPFPARTYEKVSPEAAEGGWNPVKGFDSSDEMEGSGCRATALAACSDIAPRPAFEALRQIVSDLFTACRQSAQKAKENPRIMVGIILGLAVCWPVAVVVGLILACTVAVAAFWINAILCIVSITAVAVAFGIGWIMLMLLGAAAMTKGLLSAYNYLRPTSQHALYSLNAQGS